VYCQYTKNMSHIRFDLRKALEDVEAKTGIRISYESLAKRTGLSVDTLKSIATRGAYNVSLRNIASISDALKCNPIEYLIWEQENGDSYEN